MSSDEDEANPSPLAQLKLKQGKERKELQAKITSLKHSTNKNDKKRKKEVSALIEQMESEQKAQHEDELSRLEASFSKVVKIDEAQKAEADDDKAQNGDAITAIVTTAEPTAKKPTKAQQRREKKAEELKRKAAIAAEDEANAQFSQAKMESDEIGRVLSARRLQLFDIPPDGDCLFNALSHQINRGMDFSGAQLRYIASKYIRENQDDFRPFLTDDGGNALDEFGFIEYCNNVERTSGEGGAWGGEAELRAISSSLNHRIEVLQPGGQVFRFGEQFTDKQPLVVTFHRFAYALGEHYNSTVPATKIAVAAD